MDLEKLQAALSNEDNLSIIETNIQDIKSKKNDILQNIGLKKDNLKEYHSMLKDYRYIDDIKDIKYGTHIRWINLNKVDKVSLNKVAIVCDIKILDKGVALCLKSFGNRFFTIYLNENLIFQMISLEEKIILKAINYLKSG